MKKTWIAVLLLTAVTLAGCTTPTGSDSEHSPARGLVMEEATIQNPSIIAGQRTQLVVRLVNTNPAPVEDVALHLTNYGSTVGDIAPAPGPSDAEDITADSCSFDAIPAATVDSPTHRICVWDLSAPNTVEQRRTYPVTITLTYTATLSMLESLKFTFVDALEGTPQQATSTVSNGEIELTTSHPAHIRADQEEIPLTLTVRNIGPGRLQETGDRRQVSFDFRGTLLDTFDPKADDGCRKSIFLDGASTAERECRFTGEGEPQTVYTLSVDTEYQYLQTQELPFTVRPSP